MNLSHGIFNELVYDSILFRDSLTGDINSHGMTVDVSSERLSKRNTVIYKFIKNWLQIGLAQCHPTFN